VLLGQSASASLERQVRSLSAQRGRQWRRECVCAWSWRLLDGCVRQFRDDGRQRL